jgi:SAM-dependent methyltransferase
MPDQCPNCKTANLQPWLERADGLLVLICPSCKLGVREDFGSAWSDDLYQDDYFEKSGAQSLSGYTSYSDIEAQHLAWVPPLVMSLCDGGTILDVGAASGYVLDELSREFSTTAIEPNSRYRELLAARGHRIGGATLDEAHRGLNLGTFDVVSAISVIEHLPNFSEGLRQIRELLSDGGVCILELPVIDGSDAAKLWLGQSLEHVTYPTPEGIESAVQSTFGHLPSGSVFEIPGAPPVWMGIVAHDAKRQTDLNAFFDATFMGDPAMLPDNSRLASRVYFEVLTLGHLDSPSLLELPRIVPFLEPVILSILARLIQQQLHDYERVRTRITSLVQEHDYLAALNHDLRKALGEVPPRN